MPVGTAHSGNGARGVLDYALGKDTIRCAPEIIGGTMAGASARELAAEFAYTRSLRPDIKNPVHHLTLSGCPYEKIGDEKDYSASDTLADTRPNPEDDCVRSDLRRHIIRFAGELSPSMRKAIHLRDLEGLTISEGARILGVAEGTFKCQVSRARSKLKRLVHGVKKERFK